MTRPNQRQRSRSPRSAGGGSGVESAAALKAMGSNRRPSAAATRGPTGGACRCSCGPRWRRGEEGGGRDGARAERQWSSSSERFCARGLGSQTRCDGGVGARGRQREQVLLRLAVAQRRRRGWRRRRSSSGLALEEFELRADRHSRPLDLASRPRTRRR